MKPSRSLWVVAAFACLFTATAAHATATRTFVASTGLDTNTVTNCGRGAPCRNFSAAFSVTTAGGEIVALDTAGFGGVTITHAVTITPIPGEFAYVAVAAASNGITINAGPTDLVVLRALQVSGSGAGGSTGVRLNSGNLAIENSRFTQLTDAVVIAGTPSSNVTVDNSSFLSNATHGLYATGGAVNVQSCDFVNNGIAVQADNQGPDQDPSTGGTTPRVTVVRVSGGLISNNTVAFTMNNSGTTGTRSQGSCNAVNIFLRNDTNIVGNPTFLSATGSVDANGTCVANGQATIGGYSSQNANGSQVANQ
jgi:hypothetical protein